MDIELYQYAKSDIYFRYQERFKDNMEKAIIDFQNRNLNYKFRKSRHLLCILYRWLLYRNIEYILHKRYH